MHYDIYFFIYIISLVWMTEHHFNFFYAKKYFISNDTKKVIILWKKEITQSFLNEM